jgi:hypothetical protein
MEIAGEHDSELGCLMSLVGDVVAIMTHEDRELLDQWLLDHGASRDDPPRCMQKSRLTNVV